MYNNNINQQYQQQQQQYQFQQQQQQQQQQQYYQSAVGANFQYNAGFGQPLMHQQQYQYQQQHQQYQPARPGWAVSREEKAQYDQIFSAWDLDHSGYISGERAREIFGSSGLPPTDLGHIWALADPNNHGKLNKDEFAVAMHLVYRKLNGGDIPPVLPDDLVPPSTRDISETLDFVKKSLMADIPSRAGTTNWGSYGSPSSQTSSTSLSKRLSVRSPDDVGYVSSARRGNVTSSPASLTRHAGSQENSVGRLKKEISEQQLILEATLARAADPANSGEDREVLDLKEQIRNAQARLLASSNESIHYRLRSGAEDLSRLREERRNMDHEVTDLLRTVSLLSNKVRDADKSLEESRLELAKLKSGAAASADAGIIGTGPGGSITAEDKMKARIALMKAQRLAALTGKPIPTAAQAGIDPDQAARIRAERDVNEQNVAEIELAVRRLEDTMRQLERDLDNHARSQTGVSDSDRRKWEEGAGIESDVARRFIQDIKALATSTPLQVSSYQSLSSASGRQYTSTPSQRFGVGSSVPSSPPISSSASITSSPTVSSVGLTGKTPEERRAIIRAQAEKRLRDRQNDILSKTQSSRVEASSPSLPHAVPEVDAFTSAKFEEAERLAREKLLANAESKRRQAELERQAERDLKANQEKLQAAQRDEHLESERRAAQEAQRQLEAAERAGLEEQEVVQRKQEEELKQSRMAREQEEREERERKERFAQSTLAAKQQHQALDLTLTQGSSNRGPVRITLDSNPFAKHRKSISSSDDDWDTTSPVNATPPANGSTVTVASSSSNNPFFRMMTSTTVPLPTAHSKDTSDGWDVVEKEVDLADQLSQKQFSSVAVSLSSAGSDIPLAPPPPPVASVPVAPSQPAGTIPVPPPQPSGAIPIPPPPPAPGTSSTSVIPPGSQGIPVPPPAPIGVPAAPPGPQAGGATPASTASGARGALLSQIQTGIRLKKAVTKDKSTVKGVGRVLGDDSSSLAVVPDGESAAIAHISSNSDQRPLGMPVLGGLFAGGMPTLKKSTGINTGRVDTSEEVPDIRRESTDWFGRLASHSPAEENATGTTAVPMSSIQELPSAPSAATASAGRHALSGSSQDPTQSTTSSASLAKVEDSAEDKIDFNNGYRAKSLWAYSAGAPDQLSFIADEYLHAYPSKESGNTDWMYGISEKNSVLKGWFPKAYVQQVEEKFQARALFAYTAQNEGELSVERGDIVDVLEKPDPQWWRAQASSTAIGMLPATYLEEYIDGQPLPEEQSTGKAKVLYSYAGQSSEELSVDLGETVDIMDKPDPLWWRVRNEQGVTGMLPSAYLEEVGGQSTSELDPDHDDSDSSEYESADEAVDGSTVSGSIDTDTETSDDSDSDIGNVTDRNNVERQNHTLQATATIAPSVPRTPSIAIAPAPRYRAAPPIPTGAPLTSTDPTSSRSDQLLLSTSPTLRPNMLLRKQSEGSLLSLLSVPTTLTPTMRQRSGSHSEALSRPFSHPRFTSESQMSQPPLKGMLIDRSPSPLLLNSPSWSASVGMDMSQSLSEKERKRQEAIHELITTERVYLGYLYLVRDEFQRPLLDQGLISPFESQSLFMEWPSLLNLSRSIVDELTQRQESEQGVVLAVGDVINSLIVERAGCFMRYCANHREAANLLVRRLTESRLLLEFITAAKSRPSCRGMDISSFLLQPLQRITRYPLLIKKILEYTDEDHIDHLLLSEALISAESFLDRINESIRSGEDRQKLSEIQRKLPTGDLTEDLVLTSETKFLGPRRILQEGSLRKAKSGRKLYAYLCNDLLLLFVPGRAAGALVKSASYTSLSLSASSPSLSLSPSVASEWGQNSNHGWTLYHAPLPLAKIKVKPDANDDTKFTIVVASPVPPSATAQFSQIPLHLQTQQSSRGGPLQSMIHVKASSARERKAWLCAVQKAIENLAKTPRDYGMRTSIRPSLAETIGTMTIRVNEGLIPSREFAKSRSFVCTISLGDQLFTTRPSSTDHPFSGALSIHWRESTIFAITDMNHVLDVKLMSTSPFSPDVLMGSAQVPFHTVVPFGERGTEVLTVVGKDKQIKFHMSYKAL